MAYIRLKINDCSDCPYAVQPRTPGSGFAHDIICSLLERKIATYVEWRRDIPPIPLDCPVLITRDDKFIEPPEPISEDLIFDLELDDDDLAED